MSHDVWLALGSQGFEQDAGLMCVSRSFSGVGFDTELIVGGRDLVVNKFTMAQGGSSRSAWMPAVGVIAAVATFVETTRATYALCKCSGFNIQISMFSRFGFLLQRDWCSCTCFS